MGAEIAAKDGFGIEVKPQGLPVTRDVRDVPQQQHQHTSCSRCCCPAGIERIFSNPEAWGRPDDTRKTLPEQWHLHTSNWRYANALCPYFGPPTFTLGRVWLPFLTVLALCVVIKMVEGRIAWQLDQYNYSLTLYRSSQFMLSLLLAFRLNRTYDRWWQARSAFGGIGGGLCNVVRQVVTYMEVEDPVLIRSFQKWSMCMVYAVIQLINNTPKVTDPRVTKILDPQELSLYNSTTKPAKLCGTMLSALTSTAGFNQEQELLVNQMIGQVAANVSQVARIKLQAMPFGMSLFCTGWTYIWLLVLPFGIFPEASWWAMLPIGVMAGMMLGLEDLAVQLEDPFRFMPYEAMAATTAKDMPRTVAEVQACKQMIQQKYVPPGQVASMQDLPPWPELKPQPQRA